MTLGDLGSSSVAALTSLLHRIFPSPSILTIHPLINLQLTNDSAEFAFVCVESPPPISSLRVPERTTSPSLVLVSSRSPHSRGVLSVSSLSCASTTTLVPLRPMSNARARADLIRVGCDSAASVSSRGVLLVRSLSLPSTLTPCLY